MAVGERGRDRLRQADHRRLSSQLADLLDRDELWAVLGHELGHVLCDHVLYQTALASCSSGSGAGCRSSRAFRSGALRSVLLEWSRSAELSADRAGALACRDPVASCRALMVLAAGLPPAGSTSTPSSQQAAEYNDWDAGWDQLLRFAAERQATHPYSVRRVVALTEWVRSGEYDRILGGSYLRRGEVDIRGDTDAAVGHYLDRFLGRSSKTRAAAPRARRARVADWMQRRESDDWLAFAPWKASTSRTRTTGSIRPGGGCRSRSARPRRTRSRTWSRTSPTASTTCARTRRPASGPRRDFFLWKITERYEALGELGAALNGTPLAGWLTTPYSYLATTKASQYTNARRARKLVPQGSPYLVVYPFVKVRPWYSLSEDDRQRAMDEHIRIGREEFPGIKNHTSYSFGIDDQEFMTAFECDEPADFMHLMLRLRDSEASAYTERDVPIFVGQHVTIREALAALTARRLASSSQPVA